jgi:hypothetical protein
VKAVLARLRAWWNAPAYRIDAEITQDRWGHPRVPRRW